MRLKGATSQRVKHVSRSSDDLSAGAKLPAHQHPDRLLRGVAQRVPVKAVPLILFPMMTVVFRCRLIDGVTNSGVESHFNVGYGYR